MKFAVIIPARYGSSRFPGKPLAKIGGVEMIIRVCRQASKSVEEVIVATDDKRIFECVTKNGFKTVMTSDHHKSGTDRIREAYKKSGCDADVVINVQGDEPFIDPEQINLLQDVFKRNPETKIATLIRPFDKRLGYDALADTNKVKVVVSETGKALYFSRNVIPFVRGLEKECWPRETEYFTHIGIYAYTSATLLAITDMPQSPLEKAESLEQLRWLQNGYEIRVAVSEYPTIGIDTRRDLDRAEKYLKDFEAHNENRTC